MYVVGILLADLPFLMRWNARTKFAYGEILIVETYSLFPAAANLPLFFPILFYTGNKISIFFVDLMSIHSDTDIQHLEVFNLRITILEYTNKLK